MNARQSRRAGLTALRLAVVTLAIAFGFSSVFAVNRYERRITSWAAEMFQRQRKKGASAVGFTGSPRLQAVFNPEASVSRVLLIQGGRGERHLRMIAFDAYEDGQWHPALRERRFEPASAAALQTKVAGKRLHFTPVADTLELLPVPLEASSIESSDALERDATGSLRAADVDTPTPYDVTVATNSGSQSSLALGLDGAQRARALLVPAQVDPRVAQLARDVGGAGDASSRVARIALHLRSNHAYSLRYDPGGAEPLSDFILNTRSAHCQYFASAVVVMCRAAGVPARLVTGFYAHEPYGDDGVVVRDRDAHAWAECWIDGSGWTTVDATPAAGRPDEAFPRISALRRWWENVQDFPRVVRDWFAGLRGSTIGLIVALASVVLTCVWVLRRLRAYRRRRNAPSRATYSLPSAELQLVARAFEKWLGRRGVPCAANVTWREHLRAVESRSPPPLDVPTCLLFINAYDHARFGGTNGSALSQVRELIIELDNG
jgi:hypothetical protein